MNLLLARSVTVVAAFSIVGSVVLLAPVGAAHATTPPTQTLNVADLTPCCGDPEPDATGVALANSLSKPGVGQADTFSSTITIPSQGTGSNESSSADIRVVLSRDGEDYAECFLVLQHHDDNNSGGSQTFKVSIAKVTFQSVTVFRQLTGRCDVDLSTDGTQPGVPAVQAGDVVTASSVVDSVRTEFLSGIFVQQ